ncbi:MAG: hypothetical protein ACLU38_01845 [Dysosmobacter sp.]
MVWIGGEWHPTEAASSGTTPFVDAEGAVIVAVVGNKDGDGSAASPVSYRDCSYCSGQPLATSRSRSVIPNGAKKQEISAKIDCLLINNTGSGGKYRRLWQYEENEEM